MTKSGALNKDQAFRNESEANRTNSLEVLQSLLDARSNRSIEHILKQSDGNRSASTFKHAVAKHRREVNRLLKKTRVVAWIWANVYGYGKDELFPEPLFHSSAAYIAVVQAGVVLVLDDQYRRVACFETEDGCVWKRRVIQRNTILRNSSIFYCRIKRFSGKELALE